MLKPINLLFGPGIVIYNHYICFYFHVVRYSTQQLVYIYVLIFGDRQSNCTGMYEIDSQRYVETIVRQSDETFQLTL